MPDHLVYDVLPIDHRWVIRLAGDSQAEIFDDRSDAVARARQLAGDRAVVRVLTATGQVELELAPPRGRSAPG